MVSNHGGRQLESAVSPIDQIAPIADAVGRPLKIICDGGIRRGSHIVKALALAAAACSLGRPYLFGPAAGGSRGDVRTPEIVRAGDAAGMLQSSYERRVGKQCIREGNARG